MNLFILLQTAFPPLTHPFFTLLLLIPTHIILFQWTFSLWTFSLWTFSLWTFLLWTFSLCLSLDVLTYISKPTQPAYALQPFLELFLWIFSSLFSSSEYFPYALFYGSSSVAEQ